MRRLLVLLILLVAAAIAAGVVYSQRGGTNSPGRATTTTGKTVKADPARLAAQRFVTAWSAGADSRAAAQTNHPGLATSALAVNRKGLDGASVSAGIIAIDTVKRGSTVRLRVTWNLGGYGKWTSRTTMRLRRLTSRRWVVLWSPKIVYAGLTSATRLGTDRIDPVRAPILDRAGKAIIAPRPVVQVGLERDKVHDVTASATALAKLLKIDAPSYIHQVRGAGPVEFVIAETLRPADYARIATKLKAIPGSISNNATLPLGPSFGFARALLGAVAPATAEQITRSHGALQVGDDIGQWGLENEYNKHLAGSQDISIIIRSRATGDALSTLEVKQGRRPVPLRTTLSTRDQNAAETALGSSTAPSAIVVEQPSSGDILAVADRPISSTFDRALAGAYAPGSTFKVITTTSLLEHGFDPGSAVPCPTTITVDGRVFRNFEGESGESSSFDEDFAISCNTAFISLAPKLSATDLPKTALEFGLGRNAHLPFGAASSHVPKGGDAVSRAAMMIGQDRIVVTPLAMAGVAATVANGRWRQPRLLTTDPKVAGPPVSATDLNTVRSLMRLVVTQGTGSALASTPGEPRCKTGTAEFGTGTPPPTHA
ncbi:MAG: penicillin-binding transpeptidase domain-containing protein, partial [Gaiellales bacterium]